MLIHAINTTKCSFISVFTPDVPNLLFMFADSRFDPWLFNCFVILTLLLDNLFAHRLISCLPFDLDLCFAIWICLLLPVLLIKSILCNCFRLYCLTLPSTWRQWECLATADSSASPTSGATTTTSDSYAQRENHTTVHYAPIPTMVTTTPLTQLPCSSLIWTIIQCKGFLLQSSLYFFE